MKFIPLLLALLVSTVVQAEPLRPEKAFPYTVEADATEIRVLLEIQPGYYLYKKRFRFSTSTPDLSLGEPVYPEGELHNDEWFGDQVVFRGSQVIRIPYTGPADLRSGELTMRLQGCADEGLCYPPQDWSSTVSLPGQPNNGQSTEATPGKSLSDWLSGPVSGARAFLPPDEAFQATVQVSSADTLTVTWDIAPGYYLYKHKLSFTADSAELQLGFPELPAGEVKTDEYFGESEVYYDQARIVLPFQRKGPGAFSTNLLLGLQGCAEAGICYPPDTRKVAVDIPDAAELGTLAEAPMVSEQDRLARLIGDGNLLLVLGTFFGLGLLLAFTPCVLPMVPILSGIIVGQGGEVTTRRALSLSIAYVAGMALTYTIAGAAFAAVGQQAQTVFQQPWIIVLFSALFVALALAMFGLFELQLPSSMQTRLSAASNRQGGTYLGTVIMGALSALIVSACVAPPLVAALAVIGQAGDIVRGGAALFALSLGMGAPLIAFGASAGKLLPKAGAWMEAVKAFFGFLLLGVALWMLDRVLPGWSLMLLWAALALAFGYFMVSQARQSRGNPATRAFTGAAGLMSATWGVLLLTGLSAGNVDLLQPLKGVGVGGAGTAGQVEHIRFKRIKTVADLEREVAAAAAVGQPVLLDFYADWCVSCKEMERYTFPDPAVQAGLEGVLMLQADVTANDEDDKALLQHFDIFGPPTIAFFGEDGQERRNFRVVGYMPAAEFATHLEAAFAGR